MSLTGFIDDGYNREGIIKAEPRRWPRTTFIYRPMTGTESAEHGHKSSNLDSVAWYAMMCRTIALKIVAWSVKNGRDESVAVNPENVGRISPELALRMWKIITGAEADDGEDDTGNSQAV